MVVDAVVEPADGQVQDAEQGPDGDASAEALSACGQVLTMTGSREDDGPVGFREPALLRGETVLFSKFANAIVDLSALGLTPLFGDKFLWTVGLHDQEAVGGKLWVTNVRVIFSSHRFNRGTGTFSVLLPTVTSVADTSFLAMRKFEMRTGRQRYEFVVWGVPETIGMIQNGVRAWSGQSLTTLISELRAQPEVLGMGLTRDSVAEAINIAMRAASLDGELLADLAGRSDSRYAFSSLENLAELMELGRGSTPQ